MIFKDRFLKHNILMFFSTTLTNLANFLYQLLIVRKLAIASYGVFNSLLSLFMIFSLPLASLSTMIAKFTSSYNNVDERKKVDALLSVMLRHMGFIAIFFLALYLVFAFCLKDYLRLDSIVPIHLTGFMLTLTILSTVTFGGLQGLERFAWFSVSSISTGVSKLVLTLLFLSLGWDLVGALGGYLGAQIIGLFLCLYPLKKIFYIRHKGIDIDIKEKYKFVVPTLVTLGVSALVTNIDMVLVKHFFNSSEAGYYSIAQLIGKMVLFMPSAVYIVILPRASGLNAQKKDSRFLLKKGLRYTAFLSGLVLVVYNLFPVFMLKILTGKVTAQIILLGRFFAVAMFFFSLVAVLILYQLSISRFTFLKNLVVLGILEIIAILIFHSSLFQVVSVLILTSLTLFILNLKSAFKD
ncbi:MAG: oligosaccharide flippase family protein [Candidatus Omnitrophica bacterium]|nr:oligosaccharide flippase family protein [Candidatus Omnitrophota bacterium]